MEAQKSEKCTYGSLWQKQASNQQGSKAKAYSLYLYCLTHTFERQMKTIVRFKGKKPGQATKGLLSLPN